MIIAHQYSEAFANRVSAALDNEVRLVPVAADAPWTPPADAEVLFVDPGIAGKLSPSSPRPQGWPGSLRWVHMRSTGIDRFPAWFFEVPLITVSRGAQAVAIAEYVLTAMLAFEKRLPVLWVSSREDWGRRDVGGLAGRTLGIVGFGHIGAAVARRALAFEMRVLGSRRTAGPSGMDGVEAASLKEVLRTSDHLLISTPMTAETRNMFDDHAFGLMKRGAHLVNVGRGAVVDTDALHRALDSGIVAMASLDVTNPEPPPPGHWLYTHPNVHLTAHISSTGPSTEARAEEILLGNIAAYRAGDLQRMHGIVLRDKGY